MATAFTHAFLGVALGQSLGKAQRQPRVLVGLALAAALPDFDVLAFSFDIPYHHWLGHRGFTHSLFFALLIAPILATLLTKFVPQKDRLPGIYPRIVLLCFLSVASHGFLDALTDAGLGVAFLIPFSTERYFLPWRPLVTPAISPLSFFSLRSLPIVISEWLVVWLPTLGIWALVGWLRRRAVQ